MARYIDADKIHYPVDKRETGKTDWHRGVLYMKDTIDRQPTADVEEVKHGEWVKRQKLYGIGYEYVCSACKKGIKQYEGQPICCECGAIMDGGRKNGL